MEKQHSDTHETGEETIVTQDPHSRKEENWLSPISASLLERADTLIYAIVGVCFLFGAVITLVYTFWDFGLKIIDALSRNATGGIAQNIIQFVSDLLLVLIIMEVLGTITHYLKSSATSLRPFLFIGIISATRSILSVGARLSVTGSSIQSDEFRNAMIELGVSAAVVLALGVTIKLLGKEVDDISARDE